MIVFLKSKVIISYVLQLSGSVPVDYC